MKRIKARLTKILKKLVSKRALLRRAQRRYKANKKRAFTAHNRQLRAQEQADKARKEQFGEHFGEYDDAEIQRWDKEALRQSHVAYKNHMKAQYWLGRVKTLTQQIEGLETREGKIKGELLKWRKNHGVVIKGNHIEGGTPGQRWKAALLASVANCSSGKRRNFYSMSGSWDIDHEIVGGPEYGHRSDCSSTVTGWAKACGLPDPNGEDFHGGYTGTLIGQHNGWEKVSQYFMETSGKPGYIVYGPGVGHHVEAYLGPGTRTAGHGSPPVDFGVIPLFGDSDYRCYSYMG